MRSNPLSERKVPRFFPVYAGIDRPFSRALNICTGCPTIKTAPFSVGWQFITLLPSMSIRANKTRRFSRRSRASGYRLSEAVDFEEWAATENPAAALLPPDSLIAHLPACRAADSDLTTLAQGRTIDAGKLRFAETPLFDSQQIARIYRDDGLFLGAVKIENDTARATLVAIIGIQAITHSHRKG